MILQVDIEYPVGSSLHRTQYSAVWLDHEIKRLKARIALIEEKGRIAGQETKPPRITFGGKAFYRSKDTTDIDMAEWHRARDTKREHMILFSGRFDAKEKSDFHPTRKRVGFSPLIYNT